MKLLKIENIRYEKISYSLLFSIVMFSIVYVLNGIIFDKPFRSKLKSTNSKFDILSTIEKMKFDKKCI